MTAPVVDDIERLHDRRWWTLAVLCLSLMIVIVGNSSLNVTLPTLARELHATESQLQWVVASYSLVFAGLLFSTGALGDRFGRKGTLQLGLALFLVAAAFAAAVDVDARDHRLPGRHGRRRRADHAGDAVDHHQRVPAGGAHEGHRHLGQHHRGRRRVRPLISGWLLGHFWYGVGVPRQRPDHRRRPRGRPVPRAPLPRPGGGQARPDRRGAVDHRHRGPRLRPHRGARAGMARARRRSTAFARRRRRAHAVRALGAAQPRRRCSTCTCSGPRRSAPAPPG